MSTRDQLVNEYSFESARFFVKNLLNPFHELIWTNYSFVNRVGAVFDKKYTRRTKQIFKFQKYYKYNWNYIHNLIARPFELT